MGDETSRAADCDNLSKPTITVSREQQVIQLTISIKYKHIVKARRAHTVTRIGALSIDRFGGTLLRSAECWSVLQQRVWSGPERQGRCSSSAPNSGKQWATVGNSGQGYGDLTKKKHETPSTSVNYRRDRTRQVLLWTPAMPQCLTAEHFTHKMPELDWQTEGVGVTSYESNEHKSPRQKFQRAGESDEGVVGAQRLCRLGIGQRKRGLRHNCHTLRPHAPPFWDRRWFLERRRGVKRRMRQWEWDVAETGAVDGSWRRKVPNIARVRRGEEASACDRYSENEGRICELSYIDELNRRLMLLITNSKRSPRWNQPRTINVNVKHVSID